MYKLIEQYYLNPQSIIFKIIYLLNERLYLFIFLITISLNTYPMGKNILLNHQIEKYKKILTMKENKLSDNNIILNNINTANIELAFNNNYIVKTNNNIKKIVEKNKSQIELLQWNNQNIKTATVIINGRTPNILNIINELNTLDNIRLKELNLIKLDRDFAVQLNLAIQLTNNL